MTDPVLLLMSALDKMGWKGWTHTLEWIRFAVVVAAGEGRRMGFQKQFMDLAGRPMWLRSLAAIADCGVLHTVVVARADRIPQMQADVADSRWQTACTLVAGGGTRHASVAAGMAVVHELLAARRFPPDHALVAIHDAARPFVSARDVERTFAAAEHSGAAILGMHCRDTVKRVADGQVERTIPRDQLFLAQTPQVVRGDRIAQAYLQHVVDDAPTDDSALFESFGWAVACVEASSFNGKITTPDDLDYANWLANRLWGDAQTV